MKDALNDLHSSDENRVGVVFFRSVEQVLRNRDLFVRARLSDVIEL